MKNLQTLANELAKNTSTVLSANDLNTIKGGCFFSFRTSTSYSSAPSYSCKQSSSYSCGNGGYTNNDCNNSSNQGNGRGNGGGGS